jgi:O-antigen ligase
MAALQERAGDSRWSFVREGVGRSDVSVEQRETLRRESVRLYTEGGVLGEGPVSTKARLERDLAPFPKEAHNDYFAALLERGAIGVVGLILLVGGVAIRGVAVTGTRFASVSLVLPRPHALAGAVGGTMVAMTVYELLHVRHVWALFAIVAALYLWSREWQQPAAS